MKLRDIVLSATIGLGLVGCNDKKVESLYDPSTFPKADSIVFASYSSLFMKKFNKPLIRVTYELEEIGNPKLNKIILNFLKNKVKF